jgi:hypothetical protein
LEFEIDRQARFGLPIFFADFCAAVHHKFAAAGQRWYNNFGIVLGGQVEQLDRAELTNHWRDACLL